MRGPVSGGRADSATSNYVCSVIHEARAREPPTKFKTVYRTNRLIIQAAAFILTMDAFE